MVVMVTVRVYAWQHPDLVAFAEDPANHAGLVLKDCIRAYAAGNEELLFRSSGQPRPCRSRMQLIHCRLNTKTDPDACELYLSMKKYGTKASFLRRLLCRYIAPQTEPYAAFSPAVMGLTGAPKGERPAAGDAAPAKRRGAAEGAAHAGSPAREREKTPPTKGRRHGKDKAEGRPTPDGKESGIKAGNPNAGVEAPRPEAAARPQSESVPKDRLGGHKDSAQRHMAESAESGKEAAQDPLAAWEVDMFTF